jgi:carbamate kinase
LHNGTSTQKVRKKSLKKSLKKSSKKKFEKKFGKMFEKKFAKKVQKYYKLSEGGREGGWRIVIPMPEAINFVDGRRHKHIVFGQKTVSVLNKTFKNHQQINFFNKI